MIKKILIILTLLCLPLAAELRPVNCEPVLQPHLIKILHLPEMRTLIENVQKEGPLTIRALSNRISSQFGAFWDIEKRTICINPYESEGDIIGSLIFELHNAAANPKILQLEAQVKSGQINEENYVRSMEYIEYENSKMASEISKKGIKQGLFPRESYLPTYQNFEEHYYYQQQGGHTACHAQNYRNLTS